MSHAYCMPTVRSVHAELHEMKAENKELKRVLRQAAMSMGLARREPADLLAGAEQLSLSLKTMCKDWGSLAEQIRDMQRKLAAAEAENKMLQRQLAAERARSQALATKLGEES